MIVETENQKQKNHEGEKNMSTQREAAITTQDKTKELVIDALFIALTFAATMFTISDSR